MLPACAGSGNRVALPTFVPAPAQSAWGVGRYVKHVVIVVQENRSFDNFFHAFPGADAARSGVSHTGASVALHEVPLASADVWHDWKNAIDEWNGGRMNGFDLDPVVASGAPAGAFAYSYVSKKDLAPYWTLASEYVLADHMFPTEFGPSFTGHLSLIAGTDDLNPQLAEADGPDNEPWGCDAPPGTVTSEIDMQRRESNGPFPCFTQFRTLADSLDAAHLSWRYYAPPLFSGGNGGIWSEFDAIRNVRFGHDWKNVIAPQTRFLTDARRGALANVSWVIPDAADSDHAGGNNVGGPSWVANVVNAVGEGPDWNTTAIVVVWDDWGGWYDHVPPPQLDFRGLGIRVPCIIVSPYAKSHYVSHTVYEFGSIVRFVEEAFGLSALGTVAEGYTDARARSLGDSFDFHQKPRTFAPIPAPRGARYFLTRPPSYQAPDNE